MGEIYLIKYSKTNNRALINVKFTEENLEKFKKGFEISDLIEMKKKKTKEKETQWNLELKMH